MAEIHIQKKKKPVWPWVIALILIIVVILLLVDNGEQRVIDSDLAKTEVPEEVTDYIKYVRQTDPEEKMDQSHEYSSQSILKLASALDALVNETNSETAEIKEKKEQLKQTAQNIQKDPQSLAHADSLRSAFELASDIIVAVQEEHFPEVSNEVQNLKSTARAVDPNTPALKQGTQIIDFFEEAAFALDAMTQKMSVSEAKIGKTKKRRKNEN
ncbi:MAG: hypothetical protein H0V01_12005 [Bacteroidetes bacterium]|nr:hypothetical protein [Bacteroidota bacterium]HET6245194.1 hypothetical protein [Bacteroidia bacterium]